jgi:hypothetical protein
MASLLSCGVALAHSVWGEKFLLQRLLRRELPSLSGSDAFTKQILRFAWHLTSVAWIGFGAILVSSPSRDTVRWIGLVFAVSTLFPLWATRGKHLAWIVFATIAGLCFLAIR